MKVAILGGRGNVGQEVALGLLKDDGIESIVLGDIQADPDGLRVRLRKNPKISLIKLDATDEAGLVAALTGTRVVVNCAGPFVETVCPAARAAVAMGADYIDVCDDFQATGLLLASGLDLAAKTAGVALITGMGSDPGTNNILASWYAKKLDHVEEISLFWAVSVSDLAGAALVHAIDMVAGKVLQWQNGALEYVEGGGGEETVVFADPIGACRVRFVGHPQPLTLPRAINGLKNVSVKGALLPAWADDLLMAHKKAGLLDKTPVEVQGHWIRPFDLAPRLWRDILGEKDAGPGVSGLKVVVKGQRQGHMVTYTADMVGAMGSGTGLPAAIAVRMSAAGDIKAKGLLCPEQCVDPEKFLTLLIQSGARIEQTQSVTSMLEFGHDQDGGKE